jgi:alanine-glyoxylate transaminase/serine-glyoxylate transaminase/serine-pyruvate transaminase
VGNGGVGVPRRRRLIPATPPRSAPCHPKRGGRDKPGHDAEAFRALALEHFNIAYGASFGRFTAKMFRIGHLGDINDGDLLGGLAITEMALQMANVPIKKGGVQAAMDYIVSQQAGPARAAAE